MDDDGLPACYRHPDRPTGLSCSECDRPICPECMRQGPVGQRCPECARDGTTRVIRPRAVQTVRPLGTFALIAICIAVFVLLEKGGSRIDRGALRGVDVAAGDYSGIVTSMFLHGSPLHLLFNMFALWQIGPILEHRYGTPRFLALYLVSGLFGSAGALALAPATTATVGASGAIFGLMAALFVVERRHGVPLMGGVGLWIGLNLVLTFSIPGISAGGHIGGLLGGAVIALALERLGGGAKRLRASELGVLAALAVVAFGLALAFAG